MFCKRILFALLLSKISQLKAHDAIREYPPTPQLPFMSSINEWNNKAIFIAKMTLNSFSPFRDIMKIMYDAVTLHLLNINCNEKYSAQRFFIRLNSELGFMRCIDSQLQFHIAFCLSLSFREHHVEERKLKSSIEDRSAIVVFIHSSLRYSPQNLTTISEFFSSPRSFMNQLLKSREAIKSFKCLKCRRK